MSRKAMAGWAIAIIIIFGLTVVLYPLVFSPSAESPAALDLPPAPTPAAPPVPPTTPPPVQ